MNISTKGRYGLRAILDLALHCPQGPVTLASIAARQQISEGYLEQLMMPLKKSGLVRSICGARGGYVLGKAPEDISVGEVFEVLEGPISLVSCVGSHSEPCLLAEDCGVKALWQEVQEKVESTLFAYTIADMLQNNIPKRPE